MNRETVRVAAITAVTAFSTVLAVFSLMINAKTAVAYPVDDPRPTVRVMMELYPIETNTLAPVELPRQLIHRVDKKITLTDQDFECLARNIFYEAGIESFEGKIAVAQVTYNRLMSGRWGRTICRVVYAPHQFSWTADPNKRNRRPHGPLWQESQAAAREFVAGARISRLNTSQHYHADYVRPRWGRAEHRIKQIGAHIFYDLNSAQRVAKKPQ